jgi:hypothetical protein
MFLAAFLINTLYKKHRRDDNTEDFHRSVNNRAACIIKSAPTKNKALHRFVNKELIPSIVELCSTKDNRVICNDPKEMITNLVDGLSDEWLSEYYRTTVNDNTRGKNHSTTIRNRLIKELHDTVVLNINHR